MKYAAFAGRSKSVGVTSGGDGHDGTSSALQLRLAILEEKIWMPKEAGPPAQAAGKVEQAIATVAHAILDFVSDIPSTGEIEAGDPLARARSIASNAALKASIVSGSLALPPGPAGIITILPDLVAVWKVQAQMVADIAGTFGKQTALTREQMLYCLFRHAAAQAVRDLAARVGERVLFRRVTLRSLQAVARKVGVKVTQRVIAKSVARWLPIIGALGVGAYAYYDTAQVAATAIELFKHDIEVEGPSPSDDGD